VYPVPDPVDADILQSVSGGVAVQLDRDHARRTELCRGDGQDRGAGAEIGNDRAGNDD
jgi:hypothetical protein